MVAGWRTYAKRCRLCEEEAGRFNAIVFVRRIRVIPTHGIRSRQHDTSSAPVACNLWSKRQSRGLPNFVDQEKSHGQRPFIACPACIYFT